MAARAGVEEGGERGGGERGDEGGGVATTTITETLTTKSVQRAREDNDTTKRTTTEMGRVGETYVCVCAYVCATNWVRENVGAQIGFVLSCDACGGV